MKNTQFRLTAIAAASAAVFAVGVLGSANATAETCASPDNETFVQGKDHCLAITTFHPSSPTDNLVVLLHGDFSRGGPVRLTRIARAFADLGAVGVAMMRPGYTGDGRTSTGVAARDQRPHERRTAEKIGSIGVALARLKAHYRAKRLILVGHSGGALISGVLLGMRPKLADAALLISCPCDYHAWRSSRGRSHVATAQSPLDWLKKVRPGVRIVAITGSADTNTLPTNAQSYIAAAEARGLNAEFIVIPNAGHGLRRQSFWPFMELVLKGNASVLR